MTSVSVTIAQLFVLPVFDRHLGYYSQDGLDGQLIPKAMLRNFYRQIKLLPVCNNHA